MRRRHVLYSGVVGLVLLVLLGSLGVEAGVQTVGGQGVAGLPPEGRPPGAAWLDGDLSEILLSEGLVLLLGLLAGGLFVAGAEFLDSWRERRAGEVARVRGRIETALQRDRLLKDLAVTAEVVRGRPARVPRRRGGKAHKHGIRERPGEVPEEARRRTGQGLIWSIF
jgi:hypothetical protein